MPHPKDPCQVTTLPCGSGFHQDPQDPKTRKRGLLPADLSVDIYKPELSEWDGSEDPMPNSSWFLRGLAIILM